MALIQCMECGSKVSNNAVQCPNCGNQIQQQIVQQQQIQQQNQNSGGCIKTIGWIILIGLFILFLISKN